MSGKKTNRERLATIETHLEHMLDYIKDIKKNYKTCSSNVSLRLGKVEVAINNKLSGSLSPKEKTSILISLILSVSSIVVAWLGYIKP